MLRCTFWVFVVYSNALQESANSILYNGLIEELVDVLQITDKQLVVRNNCRIISLLLNAFYWHICCHLNHMPW